MDEETLKKMFNNSSNVKNDKVNMTKEESDRFQKAFEDPEFRKMFSEYMDELQDPKNREETEAYISQLEGDKKVPTGKELIRPEPAFVVKTYKVMNNSSTEKEKIFINIVHSEKIDKPISTSQKDGTAWSVPYSLGPPHMEKDKKGDNAPCFDCCFHGDAITISNRHKEFKELIVNTAIDGVQESYKRQGQQVNIDRSFHVVKGITYKQGQVPTMLVDIASKQKWKDPKDVQTLEEEVTAKTNTKGNEMKELSDKVTPAIKKGFLNNSKTTIYPETIKFNSSKMTTSTSTSSIITNQQNILLPGSVVAVPPPDGSEETISNLSIPSSSSSSTKTNNKEMKNEKKSSSSFSQMKEVSTVNKPRPTTTTTEDEEEEDVMKKKIPKWTVKERGVVSMGDFEALKNKISSNRPAELVYTIELPLVTKSSEVNLDVSERKLCLVYQDLYNLSLPLSYPVLDTKGVAKFDKQKKTLTLTLPVKPHHHPMEMKMKEEVSSDHDNEEVEEEVHDHGRNINNRESSQSRRHSRWVDTSTAIPQDKEEEEVPLKEFIQQQVRETLDKQQSIQQSIQQEVKPLPSPTPSVPPVPSSVPSDREKEIFMESSGFIGFREGYVFKRGDLGLGYYLDVIEVVVTKQDNNPIPSPSPSHVNKVPFELQQTKDAIALLIQISDIETSSVVVNIRQFSLDIRFEVPTDPSFSQGKTTYSLGLDLRRDICGRGFDERSCSYDVANKNMVIVLTKCDPNEFWTDNEDDPTFANESKGISNENIFIERSFNEKAKDSTKQQETVKNDSVSKMIEKAFQSLQFSSNEALFELD